MDGKYIRRGTWLMDRRHHADTVGCVSGILDMHESGTVRIQWRDPQSTEYISAPMFREHLRNGEWVIDE